MILLVLTDWVSVRFLVDKTSHDFPCLPRAKTEAYGGVEISLPSFQGWIILLHWLRRKVGAVLPGFVSRVELNSGTEAPLCGLCWWSCARRRYGHVASSTETQSGLLA